MSRLGLSPEENEAISERLRAAIEADADVIQARKLEPQRRLQYQIGWGDYDWPDWRNSRAIGQQFFLEAVADVAPHVFEDLATTPLALFREAPFRQPGDDSSLGYHTDKLRLQHFLAGDPLPGFTPPVAFAPLLQSLHAWGTRYGLTAPWLQAWALNTLSHWARFPEDSGTFHFATSTDIRPALRPTDPALVFGDQPWEPTIWTWREFAAQYPWVPGEKRERYRQHIIALMEARGLVGVPLKRTKEHWGWLARHCVLGETYRQIALSEESTDTDDKRVGKIARKLARIIGLTLP